jgi:hypothetical protein
LEFGRDFLPGLHYSLAPGGGSHYPAYLPQDFGHHHLAVTGMRTWVGFGIVLSLRVVFSGILAFTKKWEVSVNALHVGAECAAGDGTGVIFLLVLGIGTPRRLRFGGLPDPANPDHQHRQRPVEA